MFFFYIEGEKWSPTETDYSWLFSQEKKEKYKKERREQNKATNQLREKDIEEIEQ